MPSFCDPWRGHQAIGSDGGSALKVEIRRRCARDPASCSRAGPPAQTAPKATVAIRWRGRSAIRTAHRASRGCGVRRCCVGGQVAEHRISCEFPGRGPTASRIRWLAGCSQQPVDLGWWRAGVLQQGFSTGRQPRARRLVDLTATYLESAWSHRAVGRYGPSTQGMALMGPCCRSLGTRRAAIVVHFGNPADHRSAPAGFRAPQRRRHAEQDGGAAVIPSHQRLQLGQRRSPDAPHRAAAQVMAAVIGQKEATCRPPSRIEGHRPGLPQGPPGWRGAVRRGRRGWSGRRIRSRS